MIARTSRSGTCEIEGPGRSRQGLVAETVRMGLVRAGRTHHCQGPRMATAAGAGRGSTLVYRRPARKPRLSEQYRARGDDQILVTARQTAAPPLHRTISALVCKGKQKELSEQSTRVEGRDRASSLRYPLDRAHCRLALSPWWLRVPGGVLGRPIHFRWYSQREYQDSCLRPQSWESHHSHSHSHSHCHFHFLVSVNAAAFSRQRRWSGAAARCAS